MAFKFFREFARLESSSGIILFFSAVLALIINNTPWKVYYDQLLQFHLVVHIGIIYLDKSLLFWVNDGLMAIFFFLVGLEIKRELFF